MGSLVDPSYELLDPTPDIHSLFCQFDARFFDGKLAACEVKWSTRMTTCAGICSYEGGPGLCSIRLSKPLLRLRPRKDLVETLLHEMIHAFLFVTVKDRDRDGHGEQFQWHMHRINREASTNITIYHSFHAEVAVYKTHHWRCEGPCRDRRPFFGWVKRTTNRAPSKNDLWWAGHEQTCGGKFVKVSEPKEFTEKQKKKEEGREKKEGGVSKKVGGASKKEGGVSSKSPLNDDPKQPKIDAAFRGGGTKLGGETGVSRLIDDGSGKESAGGGGGGGQTLGGDAGRSRLLDLFGTQKPTESTVAGKREYGSGRAAGGSDDDIQVVEVIEVPRVRQRGGGLKGGSADSLDATKKEKPEKMADNVENEDVDVESIPDDERVVGDGEERKEDEEMQAAYMYENDYMDDDYADRGGEGYAGDDEMLMDCADILCPPNNEDNVNDESHAPAFDMGGEGEGARDGREGRRGERARAPTPVSNEQRIAELQSAIASMQNEIFECCDHEASDVKLPPLMAKVEEMQKELDERLADVAVNTAREAEEMEEKERRQGMKEFDKFEKQIRAINNGPAPVLDEEDGDDPYAEEKREREEWKKKKREEMKAKKEEEERKKEELERMKRREEEEDSEEYEESDDEEEEEKKVERFEPVAVLRRLPNYLEMTSEQFLMTPSADLPPPPPKTRYRVVGRHQRKIRKVPKKWMKKEETKKEEAARLRKEKEEAEAETAAAVLIALAASTDPTTKEYQGDFELVGRERNWSAKIQRRMDEAAARAKKKEQEEKEKKKKSEDTNGMPADAEMVEVKKEPVSPSKDNQDAAARDKTRGTADRRRTYTVEIKKEEEDETMPVEKEPKSPSKNNQDASDETREAVFGSKKDTVAIKVEEEDEQDETMPMTFGDEGDSVARKKNKDELDRGKDERMEEPLPPTEGEKVENDLREIERETRKKRKQKEIVEDSDDKEERGKEKETEKDEPAVRRKKEREEGKEGIVLEKSPEKKADDGTMMEEDESDDAKREKKERRGGKKVIKVEEEEEEKVPNGKEKDGMGKERKEEEEKKEQEQSGGQKGTEGIGASTATRKRQPRVEFHQEKTKRIRMEEKEMKEEEEEEKKMDLLTLTEEKKKEDEENATRVAIPKSATVANKTNQSPFKPRIVN